VLRNTALLGAARVIERVSGAVVTLLVARGLGAADLGDYVAAMSIYALIAIGGELGVTTFLVREISKDPSRTSPYVVHLSVVTAGACALASALTYALLPVLGFDAGMRSAIGIALLAVVPAALNTVQQGVFLAFRRTEFEAVVTLAAGLMVVGSSAALLSAGHGVRSVLGAYVAVQYLATVIYYLLIRRYIAPLRWTFDLGTTRRLLHEVKPFAGSSVLAAVFSRPEVILLSVLATSEEVGLYGAAVKLVDIGVLVPQLVMMNVFPLLARAARDGGARLQEIQDRSVRLLMLVTLPLAAVGFAAAEPMIDLVYGTEFADAAEAFRILVWGLVLACPFSVLWRVLSARGEQGAVLRVQVLTTMVKLGLGAALIVAFGDEGAALSAVVTVAIHVALLAVRVRRDGTRVALVRPSLGAAAAAAAAGLVCWWLLDRIGLVGAVACGILAYAGLAWPARAVSPDDLATLRSILPRRAPRHAGEAH
jgi:O-antigen/teichoic acid export membrane protein